MTYRDSRAHYVQALEHVDAARSLLRIPRRDALLLGEAQVHATLALAEVGLLQHNSLDPDYVPDLTGFTS